MLQTRMISAMKHVKDRMDNPLPTSEMNQLLDIYKNVGATHVETATVIGHPNFVSESQRWANAIHSRGMGVTWRCAHINMEGLYGQPKFVGGNRKSTQFWIDQAVNAAQLIKGVVEPGDEWAIYPERTEGIFSDNSAFLYEGLPGSYAEFFVAMHNACKAVLPGGTIFGLSANNASELLSGWMPQSLVDYFGVVVVDHYVDGNPEKYHDDIISISERYGKPVYVQEGAPSRFERPTRAQSDAYYLVNKELVDNGVLVGFGSWSGWPGNPESIVDFDGDNYSLNEQGLSLKAWWSGLPPTEPPTGGDDTMDEKLEQLATLLNEYKQLKADTEAKKEEIKTLLNEILETL